MPSAVPFGNCRVAAERLVVVFTKISWSQADSKGKELGRSAPVEPFRVGTRLGGPGSISRQALLDAFCETFAGQLVSWCFEPRQQHWVITGLLGNLCHEDERA